MIKILDKIKCTGCGACKNICPTSAIQMEYDNDGFWYPNVSLDKCINCHLCEKVCPFNNTIYIERKKISKNFYYSGQLKDKSQLNTVSSGGAAWGLTRAVLEIGGIVYGVEQVAVDQIKHIRIDSIEKAKKITRSKYLQSDTGLTFKQAKNDLDNGRLVLYTGVGCQIAGLKSFLRKEYENLITLDVICHGVPSKTVWSSYKNCVEKSNKSKITDLVFRDKSIGWYNNQYAISLNNGKVIKEKSVDNPFHRGYLIGMYSRPSCGACSFNLLPRVSDITCADYWEYDGDKFSETKNMGVSLICLNSEKGVNCLYLLKKYLDLETTTENKALQSARHLNHTPTEHTDRIKFLNEITADNFSLMCKKYINKKKTSFVRRIICKVRKVLNELYKG